MPAFTITEQNKLQKLNANIFNNEKELQKLIEGNILEALDLHFLKSEYSISGCRVDTLAVDSAGVPVIIEYKNKKANVIAQAIEYKAALKRQKPEFFQQLMIKELGQKLCDEIELDWENPRIICIAPDFYKKEIETANHLEKERIELIEYRRYGDNILIFDFICGAGSSKNLNSKNKNSIEEVQNTDDRIQEHLNKASDIAKQLYYGLKERILHLNEDISEKGAKYYIGYKLSYNFAEIHFQKRGLQIYLRPTNYEGVDQDKMVELISEGYGWKLDRRITITSTDKIDYAFKIIERSYEDVL